MNGSIKNDVGKGRYLSVGRDGLVCSWEQDLEFRKQSQLMRSPTQPWVTTALIIPELHKLVVAYANRTLLFYDLTSPTMDCQHELVSLDDVVMTMDYCMDPVDANIMSLYLGDTLGYVTILKFLNIRRSLFASGEYPTSVKFTAHSQQNEFVTRIRHHVHSLTWSLKVVSYQKPGSFISCSTSDKESLVVFTEGKHINFAIKKGVMSFDYDINWNVIVTGGIDGILRLWDPHITTKAQALLEGHEGAITHVVIHKYSGSKADLSGRIISVSEDRTIKLWAIQEHVCLQTISHKISLGDCSITAICVRSDTNTFVIGTSILVGWGIRRQMPPSNWYRLSHDKALSGAKYNCMFNQVVTVCRESIIKVWNFDTGEQMVKVSNAHAGFEITTLAFDTTNRRLMTGASDGSIKIWNFNIGFCLRKLLNVEKREITGIIELKNQVSTMIITHDYSVLFVTKSIN